IIAVVVTRSDVDEPDDRVGGERRSNGQRGGKDRASLQQVSTRKLIGHGSLLSPFLAKASVAASPALCATVMSAARKLRATPAQGIGGVLLRSSRQLHL